MIRRRLLAQVVQVLGGGLLRLYFRFAFRITLRRSRRIPTGPVVYAANHRSFWDPPFVSMWSRDPVAFFARSSLWRIPPIRFFLDIFAGIPVDRDAPALASIQQAVERLREGIPVLVFPEGTRTRTGRLGRFRDGPALFARRAQVPVVPVYLHRSERCWPRGALMPRLWGPRLEIRFGSPIEAPAGLSGREADAWVTRRLRTWMEMQERELAGRRDRSADPRQLLAPRP